MRARLSIATSMKPQELRCASASSSVVSSTSVRWNRFISPVRPSNRDRYVEPLFLVVPLVDDADDAVRPRGLAVGAGEPAADVLDPEAFSAPAGCSAYCT